MQNLQQHDWERNPGLPNPRHSIRTVEKAPQKLAWIDKSQASRGICQSPGAVEKAPQKLAKSSPGIDKSQASRGICQSPGAVEKAPGKLPQKARLGIDKSQASPEQLKTNCFKRPENSFCFSAFMKDAHPTVQKKACHHAQKYLLMAIDNSFGSDCQSRIYQILGAFFKTPFKPAPGRKLKKELFYV
ncbi:MAG: hypothetical protein DRI57_32110 [Deltaproteobacteria bacterium]|nr:MAG: hypothetical protein DRI57_32110 [Deltaproteobacteria bacterium]